MRQAMTGASMTLVLAMLLAVNLIWGYPWLGLFVASACMLVGGWGIHWLMRPKLTTTAHSPAWVHAGQAHRFSVDFENVRTVPALDLAISIDGAEHATASTAMAGLLPGQRGRLGATQVWNQRGVFPLPRLLVKSAFPFHLFQTQRSLELDAEVAIAPRLLDAGEDRWLSRYLADLDALIRRGHHVESMHYLGSREYQYGMPVRRWDHASWARLGKPIVCEFGTTSSTVVRVVVDTVAPSSSPTRQPPTASNADESLERLLAVTATVVNRLAESRVETETWLDSGAYRCPPAGDLSKVMMTLAMCEASDSATMLDRHHAWLAEPPGFATLVLARRPLDEFLQSDPTLVWRDDGAVWTDVTASQFAMDWQSPAPQAAS